MKYRTVKELIGEAESRETTIGYIIKEIEAWSQESSPEIVEERMLEQWRVMQEAARLGLAQPKKSMGGLIGGEGKKLNDYLGRNKTLAGPQINKAVSRALAVAEVNASMGKIVAAPTAGACGILPGVLITIQEQLAASDRQAVESLFTASGIGIIIAQRACISGAAGGCQAECGAAAAMAAAAAVELAGGTPGQAGEACAIALKNVLGLVCDPVAGLVEVPCAKRNALGASLALTAADMALAGIKSIIPVDEVIVAMGEVGHCLPESLRETARGGLAATPTGQEIAGKFLHKCHN
ncbi:MAG: L-serine ammonia-lyase, iron-sulfur-dependent, subunit alpha [Peptococcaceae bacterium]